MNTYPLKLYVDLIENGYIEKLKNDFSHLEGMRHQYFVDYGEFATITWLKEKSTYAVSIFDPNLEPRDFNLDLKGYILEHLEYYNQYIKKEIREYIFSKKEDEIRNYISNISKELESLIELTTNSDIDLKSIILNSLKTLNEFLTKYDSGKSVAVNTRSTKNVKLKWLGNVNTLPTLFYDLSHEDNNLKKQLIEYDNTALTNFILDNFVDSEGNPLSKSGIYTVLNEKRPDKKAKKERFVLRESFDEAIPLDPHPKVRKIQKNNRGLLKDQLPKNVNPNTLI